MLRLGQPLLLLSVLAAPGLAWAGELRVTSTGNPVVVILDGKNLGLSPAVVADLKPGMHELGFQATLFAPLAFSQRFEAPADQDVEVLVDLTGRVAMVTAVAPKPPPAPTAAPALWGAAVEPPRPTEGALEVVASEPGAAIFLDGTDTGLVSPATLQALVPGPHRLELRTTCARGRAEATVVAGQITTADVALTPGTGTLSVTATPPGAVVLLDDTDLGAAPVQVSNVACGEHRLDVRAPGHLQSTETVAVPAYETTAVQVALKEETYGVLVVNPTPNGMLVLINGNLAGMGPMTIDPIGTGTYDLRITLPGFAPWEQQVEVQRDQTSTVQAILEPGGPPWERGDFPFVRVGLGTAFAVAGITSGVYAFRNRSDYNEAMSYYESHVWGTVDEAHDYYADEVQSRLRYAWGLGLTAVASVSISGGIWGSLAARR